MWTGLAFSASGLLLGDLEPEINFPLSVPPVPLRPPSLSPFPGPPPSPVSVSVPSRAAWISAPS